MLGFRAGLSDSLYGWWRHHNGECHMSEECHMSHRVVSTREQMRSGRLPHWALCDLPPLRVVPVREGSTGKVRHSVRH